MLSGSWLQKSVSADKSNYQPPVKEPLIRAYYILSIKSGWNKRVRLKHIPCVKKISLVLNSGLSKLNS